jgi:hypothetical protein
VATGLVDKHGLPLSASHARKKRPQAIVGEAFGSWSGRDRFASELPGGGFVQFDLSKLTLADYRGMKSHYQVNASLSLLSFMVHQSDWHIECDQKKIASHCEANLRPLWSRLVRAMSHAFWAGYSPNVLQWENDPISGTVQLTKIKDLLPEECEIFWKEVDGYVPPDQANTVPPKFKVYDGIRQVGARWPIPVKNSLWYPLLMEHGNMYGRQLLKAAYTPYFFSMLMHLFANRYYERFGEPVPIGRAPWDSEVEIGGTRVRGNEAMKQILQNLRNRSVVVLPSDIDVETKEFDYQIEYLESQMRGADFERYMTRLDEEISLALFTPLLMMRTADVGSYNLGVGHTQVYLWLLNAILADWSEYISKYILGPMVDFNFGENAPRAQIVFRKLGTKNEDTIRAIVTELIRKGSAKVDLTELGQSLGMKVEEIEQVQEPSAEPAPEVSPGGDENAPKVDNRVIRDKPKTTKGIQKTSRVRNLIQTRIFQQLQKAKRTGERPRIDFGYVQQFQESLQGLTPNPVETVNQLYSVLDLVLADLISLESWDADKVSEEFAWYMQHCTSEALDESS